MAVKHKQIKLPDVVVRSRRRAQKWWFILCICGFGLILYCVIYHWSPMIMVLMMVAVLTFHILVVGLWLLWVERRLDIAATGADFSLCLHCEYDLTGLKPQHRCPECGTQYDLEEVRACWQRWRPLWSWPKHKNGDALGGKFKHVVLPDAVARSRRRTRIFGFLSMITLFVFIAFGARMNALDYMNSNWIGCVILTLISLVTTRTMWLERRRRKAAIEADYALCLHCENDLTGLDKQQHKCPKCGTQYDLEYVRTCWMSWRPMWEEAMG